MEGNEKPPGPERQLSIQVSRCRNGCLCDFTNILKVAPRRCRGFNKGGAYFQRITAADR